jgi:hypothetical protein
VPELKASKHYGCCEGSVCKRNEAGHAECTPATEAEHELSVECEHARRNSGAGSGNPRLVTATLQTSLGTVELPRTSISINGVSESGCLITFQVRLGASQCTLGVNVAPVNGHLEVLSISGNLTGCPGFEGDTSDSLVGRLNHSSPPATLAFTGFSCGSSYIYRNDCVAGTFDLHLDGEFASTRFPELDSPPPTMAILDQHVRFEGVACSTTEYPVTECPTIDSAE